MEDKILEDLERLMAELDATNPIRPECRNRAKLILSEYMKRGQIVRLAASEFSPTPSIVMHPEDAKLVAREAQIIPGLGERAAFQFLADACDELFAQAEDKRKAADRKKVGGPDYNPFIQCDS